MRKHWQRWVFLMLLFAAGLAGCRRVEVVPDADTEEVTHLGDKTEIVLTEWLTLPRARLAEMVQVILDAGIAQQQAVRDGGQSAALLPKLRSTIAAPVLGEAKFSAKLECSLPPYVKEGTFDADLALHIARYGDREAALRLAGLANPADPALPALHKQIDAVALTRNYPVEWTQLVSLHLQLAQLKMAQGETATALEGATELVLLHKQLVELLDSKAAASPLGALLLPVGRTALADAAAAWRVGERTKPAVADDIEVALKSWGDVPTLVGLAVLPGTEGEVVARLMGSSVRGRTVIAQTPHAVRRSLDLLGAPVVQESVQTVAAFLDDHGKLVEFLIIYKETAKTTFPEPIDLARRWIDLGFTPSEVKKEGRMQHQSFRSGGLSNDVTLTLGSSALSAFVRIGAEKTTAVTNLTRDPRDFGTLHLDRSFERNRTGLVPEANPEKKLSITDDDALDSITLPVTNPEPSAVVVERKGDLNLVESVTFVWSAERALNLVAMSKLVVPLWVAYGPARIESVTDTDHGYLAFIWENEKTRLTLRLPYKNEESIELKAVDRRGEEAIKERLARTAAFDKNERDARWQAKNPPVGRLGRGLPGFGVEKVELGQSRSEVETALKELPETKLTALDDKGFNLFFYSLPAAGVTYWPRQMFVRFDKNNCVTEVQVRYDNGSVLPNKNQLALFDLLKGTNGAPEKLEKPGSTWSGVWTDLPGTRPATPVYRWLDDRTLVTFQRDTFTTEVTLRDCPAEAALGVDLPPLSFCSKGVEGCELGNRRAAVLKHWKIEKPTMVGDAVLLSPASGLYDAVLVYFEDGAEGRVVKILGQYRERLKAADASQAIKDAWGDDIDHLGAVRRQDVAVSPTLESTSWHDDVRRVRIFGQQTANGPRLYREWRELPIPAVKTAAKR